MIKIVNNTVIAFEEFLDYLYSKEECTLCGKEFTEDAIRFPYPKEEVLCKECFREALSKGIDNLNRKLRLGEKRIEMSY